MIDDFKVVVTTECGNRQLIGKISPDIIINGLYKQPTIVIHDPLLIGNAPPQPVGMGPILMAYYIESITLNTNCLSGWFEVSDTSKLYQFYVNIVCSEIINQQKAFDSGLVMANQMPAIK
jgi:hypothetical protein